MVLLAVDQGNSRTKCGWFVDGALRQAWTFATNKASSAAALRAAVLSHPDLIPSARIALSTVVPELRPAWEAMAADAGHPLTIITGHTPTPLTNGYATPDTLGPDRLMAAVAAEAMAGAPVIAVSLGTATVVDAVTADRTYLGGMIAPGIGTSAQGLADAASALWVAEWREPAHPAGRTSADSIANGLFYYSLGGIRAMIHAVRQPLGVDTPLVLTGGWADRVAPHLDGVKCVDAALVLQGIAITMAY